MPTLPDIHLCIMQPAGYLPAQSFLDPARYFRFQFRRLGAQVTLAKNRLRHDAVNFVFAPHLGFDVLQRQRHTCILVNMEQLAMGGELAPEHYLQLLAGSAVVDGDAANVGLYATDPADVPVVPFLYAPYLRPEAHVPLEERPIDLLFFGQMNPRRRAWLDRIEALGHTIAVFDKPLFGPERDQYIVQAKAVVNVHRHDDSRFEQVRAAHCLSLGTPFISERTPNSAVPADFEHCVLWLEGEELEQFFAEDFGTPMFFDAMRETVQRFEAADPLPAYADLLAFAAGYGDADRERRDSMPWRPTQINLAAGKDYAVNWLNVDPREAQQPDLALDLSAPLALPCTMRSPIGGDVVLEADSVDTIQAHDMLTRCADIGALMDNCLRLLKTGGVLHIEVPYQPSSTAWQNPANQRALNEESWMYFTGSYWSQGWFEHRFEIVSSAWLNLKRQPCECAEAAYMRMVLSKAVTTPYQRAVARTMLADFGGVPEDAVPATWVQPLQLSATPIAQIAQIAPIAPLPMTDALHLDPVAAPC